MKDQPGTLEDQEPETDLDRSGKVPTASPAPSPKVTTGEPVADQSPPKTVPELVLLERPFSSYRPEEWDDFAVASGASFLDTP